MQKTCFGLRRKTTLIFRFLLNKKRSGLEANNGKTRPTKNGTNTFSLKNRNTTGKKARANVLAQPSPAWHWAGPLHILEQMTKKHYLEAKLGLGLNQGYLGWLKAGPGKPQRLEKTGKTEQTFLKKHISKRQYKKHQKTSNLHRLS